MGKARALEVERFLAELVDSGYQLTPEAFELVKDLSATMDLEELLRKLMEKYEPKFIGKEDIEKLLKPKKISISVKPEEFKPIGREVEADIKLEKDASRVLKKGFDFAGYFRDRYRKLRKFFEQYFSDITPIGELRSGEQATVVGMVVEKVERKTSILLRLEDPTGFCRVVVMPERASAYANAKEVLLDQVICVQGRTKGDVLFAEEIIFPGIRRVRQGKEDIPDVYAVLISDLHCGSKKFAKELFQRFVLWLNGKWGGKFERRIASKVKYVIIAGDLVDGIGIYPDQKGELEVFSAYEQYRALAGYLEQIPDYIEIVAIPGNHDPVPNVVPQPPIPKKYAEPLLEAREIHLYGNPSQVLIHGRRFLLYHGNALNDVVTQVPDISYSKLNAEMMGRCMAILVRGRHLAPVYGEKTGIFLSPEDPLVVEEEPDVVHMGHIHVRAILSYNGVLLVNSGGWQYRTSYQERMGLIPSVGEAVVLSLRELEPFIMRFGS